MMRTPRPKYHAAHYNLVSARIREQFPMTRVNDDVTLAQRSILSRLAISFAVSFQKDNALFDPLKFLDACSPDTDLFPLSELWEVESS